MSTDYTFSPDDELDLEGDGFQPVTTTMVITETEIVEHANGQRWQIFLEPEDPSEVENLPGGRARDSGYLSHVDPDGDALRIGRAILKRIGKAALGSEKFRLTDLVGEKVQAYLSEDDNGFIRVSRYNSA